MISIVTFFIGIGEHTLLTVTIILRHGDRAPMSTEKFRSEFCQTSQIVNKLVSQDWTCLYASNIELLKPLTLPSKVCQTSQLTTIGVDQHKKIGSFFKNKYR
jgi:hypothetical protein